MAIWKSRPVADVPEIVLEAWRILETAAGDRHFVGFRAERETARVSSAIVSVDMSARIGITNSGRRYVLDGPPGAEVEDGNFVWTAWCQVNRVASYRDVTDELLEDSR